MGTEEIRKVSLRKDFTHRDRWFEVFPHCHDWVGLSRKATLCDNSRFLQFPYDYWYVYIEDEDKLYRASKETLRDNRQLYNNRWHLAKEDFEEVVITPEWRDQIDAYSR